MKRYIRSSSEDLEHSEKIKEIKSYLDTDLGEVAQTILEVGMLGDPNRVESYLLQLEVVNYVLDKINAKIGAVPTVKVDIHKTKLQLVVYVYYANGKNYGTEDVQLRGDYIDIADEEANILKEQLYLSYMNKIKKQVKTRYKEGKSLDGVYKAFKYITDEDKLNKFVESLRK